MSKLLAFEVHHRRNSCANCICRKENYPKMPSMCFDCGFLREREMPYSTRIPVFKDEFVPQTVEENLRALIEVLEEDIPVDANNAIEEAFFDWPIGTPKNTILAYFNAQLSQYDKK